MRPRKDEELEWGRWFAVAGPGLEDAVGAEVRSLRGVEDTVVEEGGVGFGAPLALAVTINRSLRVASRVLLRLGEFSARGFDDMKARAAALPWGMVLRAGQDVRFDVSANKSRLYHTGAIADALAAGISKGLGAAVNPMKGVAGESVQRVFARGVRDRWTISVDASGELLHRRGWRVEAGEAPLRETLAAGMLALAKWDAQQPLVDIMCGSGTIAIEAAMRARGMAPGLGRGFVCESWPVMKLLGASATVVNASSAEAAAQVPIVG
ncbi:MAG TPA: RNA methyltransferase, partial [Polyangia bacterium]